MIVAEKFSVTAGAVLLVNPATIASEMRDTFLRQSLFKRINASLVVNGLPANSPTFSRGGIGMGTEWRNHQRRGCV
ncbi:hypothetical protein D3C81_1906370 [compost metagenome]